MAPAAGQQRPAERVAFRRTDSENGAGPPPALPAALGLRPVPVLGHREELQAHSGQTPAGGALRPRRQQRLGGGRRWSDAFLPPLQHSVDPQRGPVQGPSDHPEPARDEPDQPVLSGLLAVRRPADGGAQGQRPKGAEGAEEAAQPPTSRGPPG